VVVRRYTAGWLRSAFAWAAALAAICAPPLAGRSLAADLDVRVRIAWGGGEPRSWQGSIRLSSGLLSDPQTLGLEADTPGSMQLVDGTTLEIFPRTPRSYDAVDLRVQAPRDAKLIVELATPEAEPLPPIELPLARVLKGIQKFDLDERGNRLLAQHSPGDTLRVSLTRDSLVFAPGEKIELTAQPIALDLWSNTTYLLSATLSPARSEEAISTEDRELKTDSAGQAESVALAVPLPQAEGVYDLTLALYPKRITLPLVRGKPLAQRKVQVVAVAPVKAIDRSSVPWKIAYELDPANPSWWERMARMPSLRRIPNLPPQQLTSGPQKTRERLGKPWIELPPGGWHAYPLTIDSPGLPHLLEVHYASDHEQTLGISLVEPNAAGLVQPIGLDSGVEVFAPAAGHEPQLRRHRLPFWPRTRTPWVLLTNRRSDRPALFGKINVLGGPMELPPLVLPPSGMPGRMVAAYYDRPLVSENFSAADAVDPATGRVFDDWLTFYQAGQRMVEALQYGGYNAVVLNVVHEGSALYPSNLLQPTPRHDTGVFFESGQDPVRKDVLELIFRLCDRAGIQVIPAVQFAGPLPELEAIRLAGGEEATGLEPIGPDGQTWLARNGARRGMGVFYNALDDRVQQAMRAVVAELGERYGRHAAFGGVAVQWTADGYAILPDETCSYDDATIARFERDSGTAIPRTGDSPLADRHVHLHGAGAKDWLRWRAERITEMYHRMHAETARVRAGAKLYLLPADLLGGKQVQQALRPTLPHTDAVGGVLLMLGIDPQRLASQPGIVLPRPNRRAAGAAAGYQALVGHWNQSTEFDLLFGGRGAAAAIHFHEPAKLELPAFDKVSPFGADKTHTLLVAQISPADAANRQRLVHSLARLDSPLLIDGGWLLPLGQEESLVPLVKVFRRLPAERFATASAKGDAAGQGVVVRTLSRGSKTYFYAVNDTPWSARLEIDFAGSESLRLLSYADERPTTLDPVSGGVAWSVGLEPYDLVGGELNTSRASVADYRATFAGDIDTSLAEQIRDVKLRANALRSPRPLAVLTNPSFEVEQPMGGGIPGWVQAQTAGATVEVDAARGLESPSSLHILSRPPGPGQRGPDVWVRSAPFDPPASGRLTVIASLRIADPRRQPKLRIAIEGRREGKVYYQYGVVGLDGAGRPANFQLTTEWTTAPLFLPNLPDGLTDLRVGFDLMGEGEVWIDQVEVYDLFFDEAERNNLIKSIGIAGVQLGAKRWPDCQQFLDDYWPRFLKLHVPLPAPAVAAPSKSTATPPATSASPSTWERMRSWLPKTPTFWR
jgi:hypothetical protein